MYFLWCEKWYSWKQVSRGWNPLHPTDCVCSPGTNWILRKSISTVGFITFLSSFLFFSHLCSTTSVSPSWCHIFQFLFLSNLLFHLNHHWTYFALHSFSASFLLSCNLPLIQKHPSLSMPSVNSNWPLPPSLLIYHYYHTYIFIPSVPCCLFVQLHHLSNLMLFLYISSICFFIIS